MFLPMSSIQPLIVTFKNILFFDTRILFPLSDIYVCLGYLCVTAELEISHNNTREN